jgi:hypothetical protein
MAEGKVCGAADMRQSEVVDVAKGRSRSLVQVAFGLRTLQVRPGWLLPHSGLSKPRATCSISQSAMAGHVWRFFRPT